VAGQLQGKVTVVTGGGRGIGRAIAELFAREGARVAILSRSQAPISEAVAAITAEGGEAIGIACDVGNRSAVDAAVNDVVAKWGGVDVLVNNAHDTRNIHRSVMDTDDALIERQFRSAFHGSLYTMQACFPYLKEVRGKIVNFGSAAGVKGMADFVAYGASKEAVRALTRSAANEWGRYGITCNAICPVAGTEMFNDPKENPLLAQIAAGRPLGRIGTAQDDIAPVALFLATDASQYITGHTLMVNGGGTMDAGR
jgi:3-oxoacyl-[acyl-carrier protein] reductase